MNIDAMIARLEVANGCSQTEVLREAIQFAEAARLVPRRMIENARLLLASNAPAIAVTYLVPSCFTYEVIRCRAEVRGRQGGHTQGHATDALALATALFKMVQRTSRQNIPAELAVG